MKITSWGLCGECLEIYYIAGKGFTSDEQTAVNKMKEYLQPALNHRQIKFIRLKHKPKYVETSGMGQPGSKIEKDTEVTESNLNSMRRLGSIGAFINVPGRSAAIFQKRLCVCDFL